MPTNHEIGKQHLYAPKRFPRLNSDAVCQHVPHNQARYVQQPAAVLQTTHGAADGSTFVLAIVATFRSTFVLAIVATFVLAFVTTFVLAIVATFVMAIVATFV